MSYSCCPHASASTQLSIPDLRNACCSWERCRSPPRHPAGRDGSGSALLALGLLGMAWMDRLYDDPTARLGSSAFSLGPLASAAGRIVDEVEDAAAGRRLVLPAVVDHAFVGPRAVGFAFEPLSAAS